MTRKQARQLSALKRRQHDVELYTKALEQGKWDHLFEDMPEKAFKTKLNKAKADVHVLSERLDGVFSTEVISAK